jgi:hypothetical protein
VTAEATRPASTCPSCGSVRVVRLAYGFPGDEMWDAARSGTIKLGGCVLGPMDRWEDEWHCWACADRTWVVDHEKREHREGRTVHDCADHGLLWDPDSDSNGVRRGWNDVSDRFRPAGFIDRLWPYLRDVPDPAPAWRPNVERIGAALAVADTDGAEGSEGADQDPNRITEDDLRALGTLRPRAVDRVQDRLERIAEALAATPTDVELHTLDTISYERMVGKWSPAQAVVDMLDATVHVASRDAIRLVARRRPALLPERDPLVDAALGIPTDRQAWRPWWRTLAADPRLIERLQQLRTQLDAPGVPLLRIAWLSVLTREWDAADAGGPSPSLDLPDARWLRCTASELRAAPSPVRTVPIWVGTDPTREGDYGVENELSQWLETDTTFDELSEEGQRMVLEYLESKKSEQQRETGVEAEADGGDG